MSPIRRGLRQIVQNFRVAELSQWFLLSFAVGTATGLAAVAFETLWEVVYEGVMVHAVGYTPGVPPRVRAPILLLVFPVLGAVVSGFLTVRFAPEARGLGTDAAVYAYHFHNAFIRPVVAVVKALATIASLATGGSGGREGPMVQIGAALGPLVGSIRREFRQPRYRRVLMIMGMAGGVSAIFRLPIGGAFFATEVLYRGPDLEVEALVPAILTSIMAYVIAGSFHGWDPVFSIPPLQFSLAQLPLYALLALAATLGSFFFVTLEHWTERRFARIQVSPPYLRPAVGALLTGLLLLVFPAAASTSYAYVQLAFEGALPLTFALTLFFAKALATALTITSGGSGGTFGPSVVMGAMIGTVMGHLFQSLWPQLVPSVVPFTLIGVVGFFAAGANAPIASVFMALELTGRYNMLVPALFVATLSYLLGSTWGLYAHAQVFSRLDSPAHAEDFINILRRIRIRDLHLRRPRTFLYEHEPVERALHRAAEEDPSQECLPVLDPSGKRVVGYVFGRDLRQALWEGVLHDVGPAVLVEDALHQDTPTLHPEDTLEKAMHEFFRSGLDELPVVEGERLLGLLHRSDLLEAYRQRTERAR